MLRVRIDGTWRAEDFAEYLWSVDHVYSTYVLIELERQTAKEIESLYFQTLGRHAPEFRLSLRSTQHRAPNIRSLPFPLGYSPLNTEAFSRPYELLDLSERLTVKRIHFASPGITDFSGVGQALGHVKDLIVKCIDVYSGRRERGIRNEILEQQRDADVLKNVKERLAILKSLGYTDTQCRQVLAEVSPAVAKLELLASRGLLRGAESDELSGG